jgi:hypothetical protein
LDQGWPHVGEPSAPPWYGCHPESTTAYRSAWINALSRLELPSQLSASRMLPLLRVSAAPTERLRVQPVAEGLYVEPAACLILRRAGASVLPSPVRPRAARIRSGPGWPEQSAGRPSRCSAVRPVRRTGVLHRRRGRPAQTGAGAWPGAIRRSICSSSTSAAKTGGSGTPTDERRPVLGHVAEAGSQPEGDTPRDAGGSGID